MDSKQAHVWVTLGVGENKQRIKALIDTGNTIKEECAITADIHRKLKVGFEKKGGIPIGTANKDGPKLRNFGTSNLICMEIDGIKGRFQIKPAVVETLSDGLNIGNGFLESVGKQIPVNLEFQNGEAILKVGKMSTPLIRHMSQMNTKNVCDTKEEVVEKGKVTYSSKECDHEMKRNEIRGRTRNKETANRKSEVRDKASRRMQLFAKKKVICRPNTVTFVEVETSRPMTGIDALVERSNQGKVEVVEGIYRLRQGSKIAVVNDNDKPVSVSNQTCLGFISEVSVKEKESSKEIPPSSNKHRMQIVEDLGILSNPLLKKNPKIRKEVIALVMEYADIFGEIGKSEIGKTNLVEFEIKLKDGTMPVKQKVRPLNPHQRKSLQAQIETWKREDIIEETTSAWASPMVPAKKAGGAPGEIRWAVDYRLANAATETDSYPIPNIDEVLERLAGSKVYSALDAAAAYHTIPVAKKSRPVLAFTTPMGLYTFKRMPFGPKNSGATYARFVDMLLQRLRSEHVTAYIDDILIFTGDLVEHVKQLRKVFEIHRMAGIKLRPKKTALFREETKYLGFEVSEKGIRMRPSYVKKVLEWPRPETTKQLRTFLGFTSYYRTFIKDYSTLTNEMNGMRMEKELKWDDDIQRKFEELKRRFAEAPVRSYPRYDIDEPFIVTTDWSQKNMAGILSQVQDGQERFIAAHGRKCSRHEANYPSTKGELASVMSCLRKWSHILKYKRFILYTDSRALKYMKTMKQPTGLWFRWLEEIQNYDFEVRHLPGKTNTTADNLSRCDHLPPPTKEEVMEGEGEFVNSLCAPCRKQVEDVVVELERDERFQEVIRAETARIRRMHEFGADVSIPEIIRLQKTDPVVAEVRQWIEEGRKPEKEALREKEEELRHYAQEFEALEIENDVLYHTIRLNAIERNVKRIVVPSDLRDACFYWSHRHLTAGHFGHKATLLRAKEKFYYPGMNTDLKLRVAECGDCLAKRNRLKLKDTVHVPQRTGFPGQRIYVDLVGPLPETHLRERYILTVEDGFTRHVGAYPIPNKEAVTVARALFDQHCAKFGFPQGIHSDNGREFENEVWEQLCDRLGIRKTTTPTYNPQSNVVERWHRTLNAMMKVILERDDKEWSRYLSAMTLAYNTKVNESTGITPYMATFGREANLPVDLVIPTPGEEPRTLNSHVKETLKRFKKIYAEMRKNNETIIRRNANQYSGKRRDYMENQKVWYLCPRKVRGKPPKLTDEWLGPYRIRKQVAEVLYEIEPAEYQGPSIVVHVARLLPFKEGATAKTRVPADIDDQGDELAEEIRPPRLETETSVNVGIPVALGIPEFDIVDIMARKKARPNKRNQDPLGRDDVEAVVEKEIQMEETPTQVERNAAGSSENPVEMQEAGELLKKRVREEKSGEETDNAGPSAKAGKLRPKRSRDEFRKQLENLQLRRRKDTETETDQPVHKKMTKSGKEFFMSSEDEGISSLIRTLKVDVAKESTIPEKGTEGSAAYDLKSHENEVVPAHGIALIPLNLKMAIPPGYFMLLLSRSGLATKGITVLAGVIDSDYRGPVCAIVANSTDENFIIRKGQRCCQGVILRTEEAIFEGVDELPSTVRGDKGFGSTGLDRNVTDVPNKI